jgi:hypothetical protein
MALSVKKIALWRREVPNRRGMLAQTLEPLRRSGANLQVVMGYHMGGNAIIEVFPVSSKRGTSAAREAGLGESGLPALLVQGDNRAGLAATLARAVADAGINIHFLVAQVIGNRYSAVMGFGSDSDATQASAAIKSASKSGRTSGR